MITGVVVTAGNAPEDEPFARLVARARAQGLAVETYAADRGYDDTENHYGLGHSVAAHAHGEARDGNNEVWRALQVTPQYQAGQEERYKMERKDGEAKAYHGLRRCRYVGWLRGTLPAYLTTLVLNLKRLVRWLTGVPFRGRAPAVA